MIPAGSVSVAAGSSTKVPSGVTIWRALREELLLNMYELPTVTLPPTVFHVYLHPRDFTRIEGIAPRIVSELQKSLTDEVRRMNERRTTSKGLVARLMPQDEEGEGAPIEVPASGWDVYIQADQNDELGPGDLGIESMLPLPAAAEFGGPPTTRIVKSVVTGVKRTSTTVDVPQPAATSGTATAGSSPATRTAVPTEHNAERASLTYVDDRGAHVFSMRKDTLSVGRGGSAVWVDVQLVTTPKVSREHFRLRRNAAGAFFIQDLSTWGTSVDGTALPPASPDGAGVLQPGAEQPLAPVARIEVADAVVIEFKASTT